MVVERDDDPGAEPSEAGKLKTQASAERREVLDYVADIARELAGMVDPLSYRSLGDDLRAIAIKALKTKYQGSDDTGKAEPDEGA